MAVDQEAGLVRWLVIAAIVGLVVIAGIALYRLVLVSLLDGLVNLLT